MKRTVSRIKVLFDLYQYDLLKQEIEVNNFDIYIEEADLNYDINFSKQLYEGVISNLNKIDRTIAINLFKYELDRLSYIDRNLLRMGTYELIFTDTPKEIIISEILYLSKEYSQTEDYLSSKFNNSVLDSIAKSVNK